MSEAGIRSAGSDTQQLVPAARDVGIRNSFPGAGVQHY